MKKDYWFTLSPFSSYFIVYKSLQDDNAFTDKMKDILNDIKRYIILTLIYLIWFGFSHYGRICVVHMVYRVVQTLGQIG